MCAKIYVRNATNELRKVMVSSPAYYVFDGINEIAKNWIRQGETEQNERMLSEWQTLLAAYQANGVEVVEVPAHPEQAEQAFARDFGAMVKEGAIIGRYRHQTRQKETAIYEAQLKALDIPIIARVEEGFFEGGDFWMLDEHTLAIGLIDRTNEAGLADLRRQLAAYDYQLIGVPSDPKNLHLDMIFNIVAEKVCLAATDELPAEFLALLRKLDYQIIHVPSELVFKHGCNVQALGNRRVIGIENNHSVNQELVKTGIEVIKLPLEQLLKTGGGPHCLTFPLERAE